METSNKIISKNGTLNITLDVYVFMDGDAYIAYSPALDLSGYGNNEKEAKESFSIVMDEYIAYAVSHKTLVKDLRAHGWRVRSVKQRKIAAPSFDVLLKSNSIFKDILENREYRKVSEPFPVIA